jgi:methylmalonyl-CoA/ethylmalonyl-CoA epimerase
MNKPVFTETMQIGILVRDRDAAVRRYVDNYGIGPWEFYQFKPGDAKVWLEHGQPAKPSTRTATAMVGGVRWELIQPLDDKSVFAQFLAATGGGVHHFAVAAMNFDETLAAEAKRGNELVLSGECSGIKCAYLVTDVTGELVYRPLRFHEGSPDFILTNEMKRFPSSRWASAIQIVRPRESKAETHPQNYIQLC